VLITVEPEYVGAEVPKVKEFKYHWFPSWFWVIGNETLLILIFQTGIEWSATNVQGELALLELHPNRNKAGVVETLENPLTAIAAVFDGSVKVTVYNEEISGVEYKVLTVFVISSPLM